jgi:hypothetical protein
MVSQKNKIAQELNLWRFLTVICRRFSIEILNPKNEILLYQTIIITIQGNLSGNLCESSHLTDMVIYNYVLSCNRKHPRTS